VYFEIPGRYPSPCLPVDRHGERKLAVTNAASDLIQGNSPLFPCSLDRKHYKINAKPGDTGKGVAERNEFRGDNATKDPGGPRQDTGLPREFLDLIFILIEARAKTKDPLPRKAGSHTRKGK
jgi:hypothetical protein